ncbi:MAG: hypothetical protein ABJN34_04795 [Litoreibacter sp.]|uniref:hypothetical protein n=1 Tax=Litoreibacter sp. TaxID=1969459 RepID=UPI00329A26C1
MTYAVTSQATQCARFSVAPMMGWTKGSSLLFKINNLIEIRFKSSCESHTAKAKHAADFDGLLCGISRLLFAFVVSFANAVSAEEARTHIFTSTDYFERYIRNGEWEIEVSDTRVDYTCITCGGGLVARLEVIAPYNLGNFPSRQERYLAERRQLCFELTSNRLGRCVDTQRASVRPALRGFQSETELGAIREIEIVFFYHDPYWPGPELLRTTITISEGATLPRKSVDRFMWDMARLTLFW